VASFIVDVGASRRGFAVIASPSNGRGRDRMSAKYSLGFKIAVVEANDVIYTTGYLFITA